MAKKNKPSRTPAESAAEQRFLPAVSVIIPMYNAEKYIGECLDSILAQTFQNFEVIVVDDCSTDSSYSIVESYMEKFGGRLRLARTRVNSGNPGIPGNMGLSLSHGEYLLVLDNDDAITTDALEKLYTTAKDFDADVVACEKYYNIPSKYFDNAELVAKIQPYSYKKGEFVEQPTLIENDFSKRVIDCANRKFIWNIWSKLIRRDFVIENELHFTDNLIQDMIFTCCLIFSAEKFVRVPYVVNRYRVIDNSLSHKNDSINSHIKKYVKALRTGFDYVDKFLNDRPYFQQHPDIKHIALNIIVQECFNYFVKAYGKIPVHVLENIFRQELILENLSSELTATIINNTNILNLKLMISQQRIAELENEIKRLKGQA